MRNFFFFENAKIWVGWTRLNREKKGMAVQELKKYPRKTCGCSKPSGHLIRGLNERSVNDGGDFCLLWLMFLKSA